MAIVRGIKDQFPFKADRNRELAPPLDSQGQALARWTDSSQRGVECALITVANRCGGMIQNYLLGSRRLARRSGFVTLAGPAGQSEGACYASEMIANRYEYGRSIR